jgi:hypothetical protein
MAVGASEIVDRQLRQPGAFVGAVEFLAAGMRAPRIDLDGKDRNVEAAFCWRASARRSRERAGRLGRRGLNFRSWAGAGVAWDPAIPAGDPPTTMPIRTFSLYRNHWIMIIVDC